MTNALANVTRYVYDGAGHMQQQIDALNRTNRFEYDALGRRSKRIQPGGQTESFGYDALGNLLRHTNFHGVVLTNGYDVLNRLKRRATLDGSYAVTYAYTTGGQRETMSDESGVTSYAYDSRNRLKSKQVAWTGRPTLSLNASPQRWVVFTRKLTPLGRVVFERHSAILNLHPSQ